MVMLYVGGKKIAWADAEKLFANSQTGARDIELRDDHGTVLGRFVPETPSEDPDWVKAITPDEIERRLAEPGYTFEEVKKRLGWE
jgi:hypothetical protein